MCTYLRITGPKEGGCKPSVRSQTLGPSLGIGNEHHSRGFCFLEEISTTSAERRGGERCNIFMWGDKQCMLSVLYPCRAGVSSQTGRAGGINIITVLNSRTSGLTRWARRQAKALREYFLRELKENLKRILVRSRSGQRAKSSLFALSATIHLMSASEISLKESRSIQIRPDSDSTLLKSGSTAN